MLLLLSRAAFIPDCQTARATRLLLACVRACVQHAYKEPADVPTDYVMSVAAALSGSASVETDATNTKVKRKTAVPDEAELAKAIDERSLYAAPFPFDAQLDEVAALFAKAGAVNCVRMRRHLSSKSFKGSVFVEFASQEEADKVGGGVV